MSARLVIFALIAILNVPSHGAVLPSKVAFDDFLGEDIAAETVREASDSEDLLTITNFNSLVLAGDMGPEPSNDPESSAEAIDPEASSEPMISKSVRMSEEEPMESKEEIMPSEEPKFESLVRMKNMSMESPEELEPSSEPELEMLSSVDVEPMESSEMAEVSSEPELITL